MTSHRDGEGTERKDGGTRDDDERGMEVGGGGREGGGGGRTNVFSTFKSQFQIEERGEGGRRAPLAERIHNKFQMSAKLEVIA